MNIRDASGTLRTVTSIAVRDAGGVLRQIQSAFARDAGGVLREVFSGLKALLSPDGASGYISSPGSAAATVGPITATISGGTGPYTYAWTVDTGWTVLSPGNPSTSFRSPAMGPGDGETASTYCTVTDTSNSQTAVSNTLTLYANNIHP